MANAIIRDGTSQEDRLLFALKDKYFSVDEMRFEDLLSLASEYSALLEFPDSANKSAGDWRKFFAADEACILASILATNLKFVEAEFLRFLTESESALTSLRAGLAEVDILPSFSLAKRIDTWFVQLGGLSSVAAARAREKIADVIEKTLRGKWLQLEVFLREYQIVGVEPVFAEFSGIWHGTGHGAGYGTDSHAFEYGDTKQFLKSNFYSFYSAVLFLQGCAADILIVSLGRHNHDPAIGLYIAFLKLFKKVQNRINEFTPRHLDFYYRDVLKIQQHEFVPDSAHLIFSPDTVGREVSIGAGTEFMAGLDENDISLVYTATNDLRVNDARVCCLHTLYFARNSLSSPENSLVAHSGGDGQPIRFVTSAKLNRIGQAEGRSPSITSGMKAQPLFGVPPRLREENQFEEARLGFAVASSVLLLKQGEREITLTFMLESQSADDSLDVFTGTLSKVLSTTGPDAFFKAFRHMFKISLTSETGWLEVEEYLPLSRAVDEVGCEANSLTIKIRIPDSAGGVVPYVSEIHGECFATDLPIIKFVVNPDAYLYPYSLLSEMVVTKIVIEVEVRGLTDVHVYNQLGRLSTNAQFNPFGSTPSSGDYLIFGNYEAARKKLTDLEVNVEWASLPLEINGFEEYYQAYLLPFDNSIFKVNLTALRDRKWIPGSESEQPRVDLFGSKNSLDRNESRKLSKRSRFHFMELCKSLRQLDSISEDNYNYDVLAKDGFFKLTLKDPPYAFGHKDYPLVMSSVLTENAKQKKSGILRFLSKELPQKPLPNPPYTPLINSISVNYKAISTISLEHVTSVDENQIREKVFHLHPLGQEVLSPRAYGAIQLVPRYLADGNLFIGISATSLSGLLTLFFHLREDSQPEAGAMMFEFSWHYLAENQWKKLDQSQVVSDTTNGFLSSGIVTLDIPADIDRQNTILPENIFWIRVSVNDSHMATLCSLYGVHAQALRVNWTRREGNSLSHLAESLPAGSIKEARFSIPGLGEVHQIMGSFGGKPPESDRQRTIRVSERLSHKNRAITPWDYEKLILQRFPELYKVKCFPCMSGVEEHGSRVSPGHLLIVLLPYLKESATVNLQPMVNALLLRDVREFVSGLSSGFVKINVRNPVYEQIQVRCKVKFKPGAGRGFNLKALNQEIVDYLSPWSSVGFEARFGWRIHCNDIQSHIHGLKYVASVSGLSMLHIVKADDQNHRLSDTARNMAQEVEPAYPWSIAIPSWHHLIEVVDESGAWPCEETGIANLAIGSTFILSKGIQ